MILKKPYAFLIKHFKLINLLLTILASYIMYKTYHIFQFFNEYIKNDYTGNFYQGFYQNYISFFNYLVLFLILIGLFLIIILFIYKKKPLKIYLTSIIFYIFLFLSFFYLKNVMITMETSVISVELSRILRDLSIIIIIPQGILIGSFLIRGLGFNLEKFDFKNDLEITEEDNEEVEIAFNGNNDNLKRVIRRFFREFNYYIKENKYIFIIIIVILIAIGAYFIYKNKPVNYDSTYNENENFNSFGVTYNFQESILTNIDYNGKIIDNNYYLVIKLLINNTSNKEYNLEYRKFKLELEGNTISPSTDIGTYFMDFAPNYNGKIIKINESRTLSLIYKIDTEKLNKTYQIKIDNGYATEKGNQINKYIYVNINPTIIDEIVLENTVNLNETLNFTNSNLKNTTLKLSNMQTTKKYIYDYEYCSSNGCATYKDQVAITMSQNNILLILDYEYLIDELVPYASVSKTINKLLDNFARIRYMNNNEYVYTNFKNSTPDNLTNKIVLELTDKILDSDDVALSFIIRNKEYLIKLK